VYDVADNPQQARALGARYITDEELKATQRLLARDKLQAVRDKLIAAINTVDLTDIECQELGYRARREIETNRNLAAPKLAPLTSAFPQLCPNDTLPKPPPQRRSKPPGLSRAARRDPAG
jgi:hypothetical protein